MATQKNQKENLSKKPQPFNIGRFTGIAFKMIGIVVVCALFGYYADMYVKYKIPVFTLIFSIAGVFLSMYVIIKEFSAK